MSYFIEGKGGKTWSACVIRTRRGLLAVAVEGDLERGNGFTSFSHDVFGARRVEIPLEAKRQTAKVEAAAFAALEIEVAKAPPLVAPHQEGENAEPARYMVAGAGEPVLMDRAEIEAAHGAPAGLTNWNGVLRDELKGRPHFAGLLGPMWGGIDRESGLPIVRYETPAAYDQLSA